MSTDRPPIDHTPSAHEEVSRARARRAALGIVRPERGGGEAASGEAAPATPPASQAQWALSLSGGGIRSATFCLGLLQALAKTEDPAGAQPDRPRWPLLAQFDFLSTVSGGGYIGGFFSSLFVRGRLSGTHHETALETTQRAYEALKEEPPARIHRSSHYEPKHPGRTALAWLRDNGRYMAPSGTGDLFYGITIAVRNWFATQYVVASVLLVVLASLQAVRWALTTYWLPFNDLEAQLLQQALGSDTLIWWSPTWALCGVVLLLAGMPLGIAYWFSHPTPGRTGAMRVVKQLNVMSSHAHGGAGSATTDTALHDHLASPPQYWSWASALGLLLGVVLLALAGLVMHAGDRPPLAAVLAGLGVSTVLSIVWYMVSTRRARHSPQGSITLQRVLLTRWLSTSLMAILAVGALASVETVAQTAWLWLSYKHAALVSALMAGLVWLLKVGAQQLGDEQKGGLFKKLPMPLIAGTVGVLLWLTVAASLDIALLKVTWPKGQIDPNVFWNAALAHSAMVYALSALGLFTLMAVVVGRFPGFLNLSTLQSLYSARITRAYLGATNHARFAPDAGSEARDVAEPIKGDSLSTDEIHRNPLAPIHYVNVCVNQSVSPGEQLVQRDRKGKPLVVAPGGIYLDQEAYPLGNGSDESELAFPLSFGEWLGVSGAAFSTGLGRGTDLGVSLALGFANVRLGRWWKGLPLTPAMQEGWFRKAFPTQTYLLDELRGLFYGDHRPYQYLSDGGHFENMAIYELLRTDRPRQVRLIVVADCGCDPDYQFEDLANLTRLVRIDHGLEIRVHKRAHGEALLNQVFARPEDFKRGTDGKLPERSGRCAIMLDVLGTERSADRGVAPGALFARIILVKPTLLAHMGVDIEQYQDTHKCFPQETTMDQFFDEAQWESYRQLGLRIGQRVFTADGMPGYPEKLWQVVMDGLPA